MTRRLPPPDVLIDLAHPADAPVQPDGAGDEAALAAVPVEATVDHPHDDPQHHGV